jgi:hypothetical protein
LIKSLSILKTQKLFLMNKIITLILVMFSYSITAQVGINTSSPDPSSSLDITSNSKGLLLPRISNLSLVTNPATGLVIFDTNKKCISQNVGTPATPDWVCLSPYSARFFYMPSVVFDTTTIAQDRRKIYIHCIKISFRISLQMREVPLRLQQFLFP